MDGLTPKQARFVREYRIDLNGTQAYVRAFWAGKRKPNLATAATEAGKLLRNPEVAKAIAAAEAKVAAKLEITTERIEAELARYAFVDAPDAIAGCEPRDRLKAMELLGKRHKMFTDKVEHSFGEMTDEQLEARKAEILAKATASATRPPQ